MATADPDWKNLGNNRQHHKKKIDFKDANNIKEKQSVRKKLGRKLSFNQKINRNPVEELKIELDNERKERIEGQAAHASLIANLHKKLHDLEIRKNNLEQENRDLVKVNKAQEEKISQLNAELGAIQHEREKFLKRIRDLERTNATLVEIIRVEEDINEEQMVGFRRTEEKQEKEKAELQKKLEKISLICSKTTDYNQDQHQVPNTHSRLKQKYDHGIELVAYRKNLDPLDDGETGTVSRAFTNEELSRTKFMN